MLKRVLSLCLKLPFRNKNVKRLIEIEIHKSFVSAINKQYKEIVRGLRFEDGVWRKKDKQWIRQYNGGYKITTEEKHFTWIDNKVYRAGFRFGGNTNYTIVLMSIDDVGKIKSRFDHIRFFVYKYNFNLENQW